MTVYAELKAKLPIKLKVGSRFLLPKRLSLLELNQKLSELEQLATKAGVSIPLSLTISEETMTGKVALFSNDWTMASGKPTNILVLINYALDQYYQDTSQEQKDLLLSKVEEALSAPEVVTFEVSSQKQQRKEAKQEKNIMDIAVDSSNQLPQTTMNQPQNGVKKYFQWKTAAPFLLSYVGVVIVCVVLSVWTAVYMVTNTTTAQPPQLPNTAVAQASTPTETGTVAFPFTVHEKGKEEPFTLKLTSYMKVDKLLAVKGSTKPKVDLIFKDQKGKTIGQTKTNDKGEFSIELVEGA